MLRVIFTGLLSLLALAAPARAEEGTLVIVGGGLEPANAAVHKAFLNARPADAPAIVIIPAASGEPQTSADNFAEALVSHGAKADDITAIRLATIDDPATEGLDESRWAANADSAEEIAKIAEAGAIWFTGGDQSRIAALLIGADGRETPMLAAIRQRLREGAVVGGSSAGAAIMSDPMITQGDTLAALLPDSPGEPLALGRGLGFVTGALVDQHFGQRARLGRLAAALLTPGQPHRIGLGIDEDTALILHPGAATAEVAGSGYVTLIDARGATRAEGDRFAASDLLLGLAASGDTIDFATGSVTPAPFKRPTIDHEYANSAPINGAGMALGGQTLAQVAGESLLDNAAANVVERHSFAGGHGVTYRFTQTETSRGHWGRGPDGTAHYTLSGVRFDIEPIDITITKAGR